ncbi:MAG: hypothetical protein OXJ64_09630 [Boseongicola sp.]|nr:hypothetical protein [Boseongicola sp.]
MPENPKTAAMVPTQPPALSTALTPSEESMLMPDHVTVSIRNGRRKVDGYDEHGRKVTITTLLSDQDGLQSQLLTRCPALSPDDRQREAHRMKTEEKLTQEEIGRRLGVSQKTISDDLAKPLKPQQLA